jgi:hypothetical protein
LKRGIEQRAQEEEETKAALITCRLSPMWRDAASAGVRFGAENTRTQRCKKAHGRGTTTR